MINHRSYRKARTFLASTFFPFLGHRRWSSTDTTMDATTVSLVFILAIIANVSTIIGNTTPFESQEGMIYRIGIVVDAKNSNFSTDSASMTLLMQSINKGRQE